MKKGILLLTCICLVGKAVGQEPSDKVLRKMYRYVTKHSKAYTSLKEACQTIGHRLTGSPNGARAEQYAFDFFRRAGLQQVRFQPFEVQSWQRGTVWLGIAPLESDSFQPLPVATLAHSPAQAEVTAPIIDVGNGLNEDFQALGQAVKGKIALINIGLMGEVEGKKNLHRSEKTALAIQNGAVGVIMINNAPGKILLTGTASVTGKTIPIPAVSITNEDGMQLRQELKRHPLQARIQMTNHIGNIKARNVIATLAGSDPQAGKILIGGHLDSWDLATGASDNGIGAFAILDVARLLAKWKAKPRRTIEFVMFMGEEQGLLGSRQYVKQALAEGTLDQIELMINVDMTYQPFGFAVQGQPQAEEFFKSIGEKIKSIDKSFANLFTSTAGLHSDHQPFLLQGIPVMSLSGNLPSRVIHCYHADCDHIELIDPQGLMETVRTLSLLLYQLAQAPSLPVKKMDEEALKSFLIANGLKEPLLISGDWRWGN